MEKSFKSKSKAFIVLLIVTVAFAVFTATTVLSAGPDKVAEASTASSISLSQLAGGNWTWSDHKTEVTIDQWKGSRFKRYTDNTLGVGYRYDSSSCVTTSGLEYTVPTGQTIESFSLSITTTAAVRIQYSIYKSGNKNPYGYDYPDSGIAAQSGNTYSVTNSAIYHRSSYKGTTLTGGDKITFAIYDSDVINHSGSTIYTGGKVARDNNIAVTALSITLNNAAYSVSIKAGTGIKEAFLSTSSVATSGSASGTKFDVDSYVYGFVKLNAGYRKPNSANWTLIDGTANQANAIYRVAEQKVGSQTVDFGTVNAEAKTKNLYKMDGAVSKGYETLNWSQAKTIPAITKTGYNFINYNTAADGTGTTYGNSSGASLTATQVNAIIDSSISSFYAQWSAKTFDVTFNKEGGTGGDDGVTMTYDQPAPGSIVVPSKPGYIFREYTATHPTNYSIITVYNSNGEATSSKWQIDSAVSPRATWYGKPYKAYITAGTGVKSVYLSSSSTATPGSSYAKSSGTSFTNGQYLWAYIVLERGYVAPAGWELSGGDYYVGDGVFRKSVLVDIASDEEEDLQYDFGTIDAAKGNFAVGISAGTGVSAVKLSAKDDGADLVSAGSKFVFDSQVYAYATLSVGYKAQDGWTLIDGEPGTAGALYLVDTIEHIDINSDFGALSATPKQYAVTLDGLDDPITATYDAPLLALEQLPTREGYTFIGYYDQPEGGNQYINEDGTSTGHTWKINEDAPQLYAHWLKALCYEVTNYHGDYDRNPHTISYAVTDPESGAVILFGTAEDDYVLAENELPTYTDVGVYTIYYQISADVGGVLYKTVKGSATVTITKVDTTALSALIDEVNEYYNAINDDYPTIASTLEGHKQQIINDYITEDNVTEAEVAAAVVELQGYLDKAHADIVDELIDAIGVVDLGKEDEIDRARVAYNNLTDVQKALVVDIEDLVDAEVELVELLIANIAPFEYTQACKDRIEKAREFYDALTADQKADVDNYQDLVNAEKAYDAIAKINAIGKPIANDDPTREKAATAREAYTGLSDAQKALVTPSFVTDLENAEDVLDFLDALNDIGTPEDTEAFRDKVDAARDLYDALDEADLETLVKPEDLKTLTDDEALIPVIDAINALGAPENMDTFRDAAEGARSDYDALTDDQKDIFPADVLKTLTDDEAVIDIMNEINALGDPVNTDTFREAVDAARDNYDALSNDQKALVPADVLKTLEDDEAVIECMDAVNAIGTPENTDDFRGSVDAARENYDALSDDQKALVPEGVLKTLEDDEAVIEFMDAVNAIGTPEDTEAFRDKVDAARDLYDALDEADLESLVKPEDLKTLMDDEAIVPVMNAIDALGTPENTDAFRDATEDARADYNALSLDQKALFPNDVLKTLTDDEAVIDVLDKIDAIGEVTYTSECKALIDAAREGCDALSADQKNVFPQVDLQTLIDAEKAYEAMDLINAIGSVEYTAQSKAKIDIALGAFEALTPEQKELVLNHTELPAAQATYDELAANNVKTLIAGIGKVKHPDSKETIDRARTAYDELTEKQKELVDNYDTLTEAEEIYASYDKKEHVSTVMGWVLFVLVILELLYLALYLILWYPKAGAVADKLKLGALKPLIGKIVLFGFIDLLLLIGSAASVLIFILALAALAVYATPISIATFVLAFLVMAAYGVLIFFRWKKRGEEEETSGEPKAPDIKETAALAEEVSEVKEDKVTETTEPVEEEKNEEVIVVTENGATFRIQFVKSFTAKLIQSSDETKRYYRELKNEILSYKGINSRASWNYESFNFGRKQAVKIAVRGKTLCLYFALDMKDLKDSKYRVELCESAKYAAVPCMYRIRNDRRCEYAKDLIAIVAEKFGLVKGKNPNKEYSFPYEDNAALLAKGLIKEVKSKIAQPTASERVIFKSISVNEADAQMADEVAATYIVDDINSKAHKGKKGIINIDTIGENFNDGDTVDIEALWEKKLVPKTVGFVKVLARGRLGKRLDIDLQDYSIQAVKMVILEGGTVKRAK